MYDDFKITNVTKCISPFLIYIHNPNEVPWNTRFVHTLSFDDFRQADLKITPKAIKSDAYIKKLSPEKRKCCFKDECPLEFFKIYTKNNCLLECYMKRMFRPCNCSTFDLPRKKGQNICTTQNITNCGLSLEIRASNYKCDNCLDDCDQLEFNVKINNNNDLTEGNRFDMTTVEYFRDNMKKKYLYAILHERNISSDTFPSDFWNNFTKIDELLETDEFNPGFDIFSFKPISIAIQFDSLEFLAMQRISTYTFVDFIAQIGGSLGLFMGVSILRDMMSDRLYKYELCLANDFQS
uniref:CSON000426 protein n=1 Tax=Culicoides sonorensis TaxID=179676 RepID=A0A336MK79_CULSO